MFSLGESKTEPMKHEIKKKNTKKPPTSKQMTYCLQDLLNNKTLNDQKVIEILLETH